MIPLAAILMAHTLVADGLTWPRIHCVVCVRLKLPLTQFSVYALRSAHAAQFPKGGAR